MAQSGPSLFDQDPFDDPAAPEPWLGADDPAAPDPLLDSWDEPATEPAGVGDAGAEEAVPTFTVAELNGKVRDALKRSFRDEVWVRGEVQNLKRHASGHTYFTLVEKGVRGDRPVARLDVALFRDDRRTVDRRLKSVPGAELGNDVEVRICGRVTLYPEQGRYQLVMSDIDPVFTVGGIAANRDRVLRALAAEGLLGHNARHALAPVPLRIGLVTSVGSAAYHDFVHELELSGYAFQIGVVDVRVQGSAAARRIKYGLNMLAGLVVDAVVLVRGGGARADLAPFDTELVARAVAEMPVPVFTGVGHEIDRSVADEVAHTACKTPTACAQVLVDQVRRFDEALSHAARVVAAQARRRASLAQRELDDAARRVRRSVPVAIAREQALVDRRHGRVDELARLRTGEAARRLEHAGQRLIDRGRRVTRDAVAVLDARERVIAASATHRLDLEAVRLDAREATVRALDPHRVLERGYSITRDADGRIVRRAADAAAGQLIVTELADGRVASRVEGTEETAS
jgi:exodeoxyribonuclease VII large subunit